MGSCYSVEGINAPIIAQQQPALCIDPNYVCQSNMLLKMKWQLSFTGDDRIIRDEYTKRNILQIDSKALCWNALINLCAMDGRVLCTLDGKTQVFSYYHTKFQIINAYTNQMIGLIERQPTGCFNVNQQFIVYGVNKNIIYNIEGSFYRMQFVIRNAHGEIVAKSSRDFIKTGIFSNSYGIEIGQGNDVIVIAAIMTAVAKYKAQEAATEENNHY